MLMEQREKIENEWKKDKRFEGEGGECSISRGRADCTVEVYKLKESEEEVRVLSPEEAGTHQGAVPKVRAAKSFEFREGKQ